MGFDVFREESNSCRFLIIYAMSPPLLIRDQASYDALKVSSQSQLGFYINRIIWESDRPQFVQIVATYNIFNGRPCPDLGGDFRWKDFQPFFRAMLVREPQHQHVGHFPGVHLGGTKGVYFSFIICILPC